MGQNKTPTASMAEAIATKPLVKIIDNKLCYPKRLRDAGEYTNEHTQVMAELFALYGKEPQEIASLMGNSITTAAVNSRLQNIRYTKTNRVRGLLPQLPNKVKDIAGIPAETNTFSYISPKGRIEDMQISLRHIPLADDEADDLQPAARPQVTRATAAPAPRIKG